MTVNNELLDRVLDGEVTAEEAAVVRDWLASAENLEHFARRAELHADLKRALRRRDLQSEALQACGQEFDAETRPNTASTAVWLRRPQAFAATIVGLVAAAVMLYAFLLRDSGDSSGSADVAAAVVSDVDAVLTRNDQPWRAGTLPIGDYELRKGLLNLQFQGGVLVYIEAPAVFEAVSDSRVILRSGRLSASVPPAGVGFTVETPEAEVVDFGTEFSVEVGSGASEVHVFDGLVRVQPGSPEQRQTTAAIDLQTSQAVRITDATTQPVDIEIARDRFIRNFDEPKRRYARSVKQLSPVAFYRMPIRDRGLVSEPPEYSGVVLTGDGVRPPHARGVFTGGSLRVLTDSTGRGGRVDAPPALDTGRFTLAAFVYREGPSRGGVVATNIVGDQGSFTLRLNEDGLLEAIVKDETGQVRTASGESPLPEKTWRSVVMTVEGEQLQIYEDGQAVAAVKCGTLAVSDSGKIWFGTNASAGGLWDGRIDEVVLFDRALSADEIAELQRAATEEIARSK